MLNASLGPAAQLVRPQSCRWISDICAANISTIVPLDPAGLEIIVGTGYGYVRPDGIQVIPIRAVGR
ncbi:MAG: hypothetical protein ACR2GX_01690 [Candidatus Dormibacteria bacterium]